MNGLMQIFNFKIAILSELASKILKNSKISDQIKNEIESLIAVINTLTDSLVPKIQPATKEAKEQMMREIMFKNVEIDVKMQELMFLIFLCEYYPLFNVDDLKIKGD